MYIFDHFYLKIFKQSMFSLLKIYTNDYKIIYKLHATAISKLHVYLL